MNFLKYNRYHGYMEESPYTNKQTNEYLTFKKHLLLRGESSAIYLEMIK